MSILKSNPSTLINKTIFNEQRQLQPIESKMLIQLCF